MIIRIEDLLAPCSTILSAVDANELSQITKTLELKVENRVLTMAVTNKEYFAEIRLNVDEDSDFHATVDADTFLKLITKITSDTVELSIIDNSLSIKGNGKYKLPLIFDNDKLLVIPDVVITNVLQQFTIEGDVLNSILTYNSKQLSTGVISRPVQKYFYVDEQGALTFTSGACVNTFTLEKPIKMLLSNRIVKLFKLFKDKQVNFTFGCDTLSEGLVQSKASFEAGDVRISVILQSDESLLNSVPVDAIRTRASNIYPYSININRNELIETLSRITLFTSSGTLPYVNVDFGSTFMTIFDYKKENKEDIYYNNKETGISELYSTILDINELNAILDSCNEEFITFRFGDKQAMIVCRGNITNIIPEVMPV